LSDTGPTTAGSIVAKLRMERDEWMADYQKTKQEARELGEMSPTIKVDANITDALAKLAELKAAYAGASDSSTITSRATPALAAAPATRSGSTAGTDAVTAAARRLAAAESASESATARAIVAEMRLEESRAKHGRTAAQIAAAELTASEAIKRSEAAAEKATLAEMGLAAAQQKAAQTALQEAAAQETVERQTIKANEANSTNVSRLGMIATAVGVLVPMLVPLAAFAVGGAGALTMMGVAGVLAVVGIRNEMAAGTATGNQYAAGISSIKGNMAELAQTAATKMLANFNSTVGLINQNMPMLNRNIGLFAAIAGQSGNNLLTGAVNGVRILSPLLLTVGQYIDGLTLKFSRWTSDGGLQRFGSYAMSTLPTVERVLSAVAQAVVRVLEALAPIGSVGLNILTAVATLIAGMPVQVLTDLITAVVWGGVAFKAWGFVAPMLIATAEAMGAMGVATTIATGPIGWISAGIGALVGILAVSSAALNTATDAVDTYTAAVQEDNGVIGENVRLQAAKNLQEGGSLKTAKDLGIATDTLVKAALGNKSALASVNATLDKQASSYQSVIDGARTYDGKLKPLYGSLTDQDGAYKKLTSTTSAFGAEQLGLTDKQGKTKKAVDDTRAAVNDQASAVKKAIGAYNDLASATGGTTIATRGELAARQAAADMAGVSLSTYMQLEAQQRKSGEQTRQTTALMYLQNDAAGLLKMQLDKLNGKALSAAQAQNQFDSQLANMSDHMDAAGKQIDRANTLLDGNSAAAVKNRGELIGLAEAAQTNAQAFRDNGASSDEARQKLIDMKAQIVENAVAHGENRAEVQAYIDQIYKIPKEVQLTPIEVDTSKALAQVDAFVANLRARVVSINVRADLPDLNGSGSGSGRPGVANGGTIGALADGGTGGGTVKGPGTAFSDTAGLYRLANGEEVTSNKFGQADRNRALLKAINAGQTFTVGASNASQDAPTVTVRAGNTNNTTLNVNGPDPERVAAEALRLLRFYQQSGMT